MWFLYTNWNVKQQGRDLKPDEYWDSLLVHMEGGRASGSAPEGSDNMGYMYPMKGMR